MKKGFEKLNLILENRIFVALCIAVTTAFGMFYYYGVLHSFMPCSEDYFKLFARYANDISGNTQKFYHGIDMFLTNEAAYRIAGFSTKALRLAGTFRYGIILLLTLIVAIAFTKKNRLAFLPVVILFLVELRGANQGSDYGFFESEYNDILSSFPPYYHFTPLIGMLMCLVLIGLIQENKDRKTAKYVYSALLVLMILYQIKVRDTIFFVIFLVPLFIYGFLYFIREQKYRNIIWIIVTAGLFILLLTKFNIIKGTHDLLWPSGTEYVYSSGIYGNTSWVSLESISKLFDSYFMLLANLFNINRVGTTIASGWIIVLFVRVVLLIAVFVIIFNVIKDHLKGVTGVSPIDVICAYGFVILSLLKVFTMFSEDHGSDRYFFSLVPIACILLVRNLADLLDKTFNLKKGMIESYNVLIIVIGAFVVLFSINNVWDGKIVDSNGANIEECIEYMDSVGDEGYAVAPPHLYARMAAQDEGKLRFFLSITQHDKYFDGNEKPRYVVSNFDDEFFAYKYVDPENEEQLIEYFGEPVEIKSFGRIKIYRLW